MTSPLPPSVLVLNTTSVPASVPETHFRLTAICCCHGKPLSGSSVTSGSGSLTDTSFSPRILLPSPQQTQPHWKEVGLTAHRLSGSGMVRRCPNVQMPPSSALELHERLDRTAADGRGVDRLERRRQRRQRSGSERARFGVSGDGAIARRRCRWRGSGLGSRSVIGFGLSHALPPSWKAESASEKDRTISLRPGTGARAFSLRTSDTPEGCETINSFGILRPRAFARISTCLGERSVFDENVVAGEPELDEGHRGGSLVMPVAHGAAGRERVAGHDVAVVQGLLGLIVQRLADVLDRVDQVQAGGEQLRGSRRPRAPAW